MDLEKIIIKEEEEDEELEEIHKRSVHIVYVITKIFTILFGLIFIIQFTYYSVTTLKNEEYKSSRTSFLILTIFRIAFLLFYNILLIFEKNLTNMGVGMTIIVCVVPEIILLFAAIFTIHFKTNVFGFVLNLFYTVLVMSLTLRAFNKMVSSKRTIEKKDQDSASKKDKASETSEQTGSAGTKELKQKKRKREKLNFSKVFKNNYLSISSLFSIVIAINVGIFIKFYTKEWTQKELRDIGFLGELFLRAVNCLIIPIILSCLIYSLAATNIRKTFKMAIRIGVYFLVTSIFAVLLGMGLCLLIKPGVVSSSLSVNESTPLFLSDSSLDVLRNLIPDNIFRSTVQTYKTDSTEESRGETNTSFSIWQRTENSVNQSNILGIIIVAIGLGLTISLAYNECKELIVIMGSISKTVFKISEAVVSLLPIFIVFLVVPQIMIINNFSLLLQRIGLYIITVLLGLLIHMFVVLPLIYLAITRKNPFKYMSNMISALAMSFWTSNPLTAMPITINCLEDMNFVDEKIVKFCIPVGTNIHMDGVALYDSVSTIFIAQSLGLELSITHLFIIFITSTLASIGAAGVPQGGMLSILIVLNAMGIPKEEAALVLIVDWFLDRFRKVVNIMSDAFGAGVIYFLIGKD